MATCNTAQYSAICDVVERTYHGWPIEHDEQNPWFHTSKEARAATNRILEVLRVDISEDEDQEEELQRGYLAGRIAGLSGTTRYDLTEEDRAVLREVAALLEGAESKS